VGEKQFEEEEDKEKQKKDQGEWMEEGKVVIRKR